MNPETIIMNKIMEALSAAGHFVLRSNSAVLYNQNGSRIRVGFPGLSDLIGCTSSGRFYAIEVKIPGEKPRENQEAFLGLIERLGGLCGVATSPEEALAIVSEKGDRT